MATKMRTLLYNPGLLPDDELRAGFIVRDTDLSMLAGHLRDFAADRGRQHIYIIGRRGMGKTTILCRLAILCKDEVELANLLPVVMAEEHPQIGDLADLWREAVGAMASALERPDLERDAEKLLGEKNPERLAEELLALMTRTAEELGRRVVLFMDGWDEVYESLRDEVQQHRLREELQGNRNFLLVAASSRPAEAAIQYNAPFHDFFRIHQLERLDRVNVRRLIDGLAKNAGDAETPRLLDKNPGRMEGIFRLTGGEPRLVVFAFRMLQESPMGAVRGDLEDLLDLLTPYYKHLLEDIPKQSRQVFDALARRWAPATAPELEEGLRMERPTIAAQLSRLARDGWIEPVDRPGRSTAYQLTSRLFNLYILMRFSRDGRRLLRLWASFVEAFFGEAEGHRAVAPYVERLRMGESDPVLRNRVLGDAIETACCLHDTSATGRALAEIISVGKDSELDQIIATLPPNDAASLSRTIPARYREIRRKINTAKINFPGWAPDRFADLLIGESSLSLAEKENITRTLECRSDQLIRQMEKRFADSETYGIKNAGGKILRLWQAALFNGDLGPGGGVSRQRNFFVDRIAEGRTVGETTKLLLGVWWPDDEREAQTILHRIATAAGQSAEELLDSMVDFWISQISDPEIGPGYWYNLGILLAIRLNLAFGAAEQFLKRATDLRPDYGEAWIALGHLLDTKLGRYEEAARAFQRGIEFKPGEYVARASLGLILATRLNRGAEAKQALRRATEIQPRNPLAWGILSSVLFYHDRSYDEAEEAMRKALDADPHNAFLWLEFGKIVAQLGRFEEAEESFRNALNGNPNNAKALTELASLLARRDRRSEAETVFRRSLELERTASAENGLAWNLYLMGGAERLREAAALAQSACEKEPENVAFRHTFASILVGSEDWGQGIAESGRHLKVAKKQYLEQLGSFSIDLLVAIARSGRAREALQLVDDAAEPDWWRPVREALVVIVENKPEHLKTVPKEIADLAQDVIRRINEKAQSQTPNDTPGS